MFRLWRTQLAKSNQVEIKVATYEGTSGPSRPSQVFPTGRSILMPALHSEESFSSQEMILFGNIPDLIYLEYRILLSF